MLSIYFFNLFICKCTTVLLLISYANKAVIHLPISMMTHILMCNINVVNLLFLLICTCTTMYNIIA